jgi:phosphate transport system permease protein
MPSIVYGLLGLTIFVRFFGLDQSIWSGAMTLSLLVLPVIIIASQEAIRAVPDSIRFAAYSLGARRWQVILGQILPAALPGIMTGVILAISRAMGESAPLIMIGALSYVAFVPEGPSDAFTVLPVQIFNWAGRPQADFHGLAGAGIIVLLIILFAMNFVAVLIRQRFQKYKM